VYLGKVSRVLPGMQSAFIDIGLERAAFLHVADVWHRQPDGEMPSMVRNTQPIVPIEKQVFEGQALMVQVIKDPIGTKGARLSTQISIAGRMLVFLPQDDHLGVSQKIPQHQRDELKARLQALAGAQGGGFILRTNGEDATDEELAEDIAYLRKAWARIKSASLRLPPLSNLHQDLNLLQRVLRDLVGERTQTIKVDSREQFEALKNFGLEFMPAAVSKLQLYKGERPIFDLYSIDEEIAKALGRRVDLKSGGYLIVDQTEALTTVDVNTGGFVGARNFDDTIFKTNAGGFSQLGLVEMTRKRTRESLAHMLCEPCPMCEGKGIVKTARSVTYDICREILREARQFNPREFRVVASPKVIELFLDEESQHLAGLSEFIGKPVSLQSESAMGQEQYDIILL
jgi:ribonuclease G